MAVAYLTNRLKALLFLIIGAVRRALCCLRRRRRESGEFAPLMGVGIGESVALDMDGGGDQEWKSWDAPSGIVSERNNSLSLIQQQIENYRLQSVAMPETEPEPDLFQDMVPRITAQPRILLRSEQAEPQPQTSRLGLAFDPSLAATSELESWEDNPTAWEATADCDEVDPDEMLREKRRAERERRRAEQQARRGGGGQQQQRLYVPLGARAS